MDRKIPRLGRGKNMSIAKAALIYFYETMIPEHGEHSFIYSGELDVAHAIVEIAGAKHCSLFTHHQVLGCINSSPFWGKEDYQMKGWAERRANVYRPSEKGKEYYESVLKNRNSAVEPSGFKNKNLD